LSEVGTITPGKVLCSEGYVALSYPLGGISEFKWSHDKIQEAVLTLVPDEEQSMFGQKVGQILVSHLANKDLEVALFSAINLLNEGSSVEAMGEMRRIELAELNLRAGQKAIKVSAFESAAKYLERGVKFLPDACWTNNSRLSSNVEVLST
jgi:predicted ATPase